MAGRRGRTGGRGNASFLTNRRRAPAFAEQGEKGHEQWYDLELALVADVALVGLPNVGKSTFISRISAAKPKIADYPFTTLEPHLGVVRTGDQSDFTVADIPGLVEGAADGRGLGHRFLRHITRARVLVLLVGAGTGHRACPFRTATGAPPRAGPLPAGAARPSPDRGGIQGRHGRWRGSRHGRWRGRPVVSGAFAPDLVISAVTGHGVRDLVGRLTQLVSEVRARRPEEESTIVIHRPLPEGFAVERLAPGQFRVVGRVAERAVALNDLTTDEAADYVQGRLRRIGVDRALARAGAHDGDEVHIGELSFVWYRDQPEFTGPPASRRSGREHVARRLRAGGGQDRVLVGHHARRSGGHGRHPEAGRRGGRSSGLGPSGGGGHLGCHRRGVEHVGPGSAPPLGSGHPPGGGGRRPTPPHAGVERFTRATRAHGRPGPVGPPRLRPPQPVPPRPSDPHPPVGAGRGSGGQRERRRGRRGDPVRRQRPAGRPGGAPGPCRGAGAVDRHRRTAHRGSPPDRGRLPHRGGGRDRPRARANCRGDRARRRAAGGWRPSWPRPRWRCGRGWRR